MRGRDDRAEGMFSYIRLEERVPADHPLRAIRRLADEALAAGYFLGVDGPLTYKKNDALRAIFARAPEQHILIETDAPFLVPRTMPTSIGNAL